jgi:GT2 family glycosyltransferase
LTFSIIIPTFNRNDLLTVCLDKLSSERKESTYEVIVSDDGRSDSTKLLVSRSFSFVKYTEGPQRGPAANRNNGASKAEGEWLVFIDDDCVPDEGLIGAYQNAIENNKHINVFEGRTYVNESRKSLADISPINETGGYLWSCNFCIRKTLFTQLDGFDEMFPFASMEDVDFRYRLIKASQKIMFVKEASVMHPWRDKGGWKRMMRNQTSIFIYLKKHPEESQRLNSSHFFIKNIRLFLKATLPGIIKYKGKGLETALTEHIAFLRIFFKLLFKNRKSWEK